MSIELVSSLENVYRPKVDTALFDQMPQSEVWLGVVATEADIVLPNIYRAARILRANRYIELGYLPENARQSDGGEMDEDDARSTHFVAVEKDSDGANVIGTMRSIVKRDENDLLPIEHYFPEVFEDEPAPVGSVEASRFISSNQDKGLQRAVSLGLMRAVNTQAFDQARQPIYAVIEAPLERLFRLVGLPIERIADAKPLAAYGNTKNMAVKFDPKEIMEVVDNDINSEKLITDFFKSARVNGGVGHYDRSLSNPLDNK